MDVLLFSYGCPVILSYSLLFLGSSSGGGVNPPLACKWLIEMVHGRTVYGPKDEILLMTA
jgi:hypothetical protein